EPAPPPCPTLPKHLARAGVAVGRVARLPGSPVVHALRTVRPGSGGAIRPRVVRVLRLPSTPCGPTLPPPRRPHAPFRLQRLSGTERPTGAGDGALRSSAAGGRQILGEADPGGLTDDRRHARRPLTCALAPGASRQRLHERKRAAPPRR